VSDAGNNIISGCGETSDRAADLKCSKRKRSDSVQALTAATDLFSEKINIAVSK
jgi:hypothetical protein